MRSRIALFAFFSMTLLFMLACSPADLISSRTSQYRQYVQEMAGVVSNFLEWSEDMVAFVRDTGELENLSNACESGDLAALVNEGSAVVTDLERIEPPAIIAATHNQVAISARATLDSLRRAQEELCQRGDVDAARRALEEAIGENTDLSQWMGRLRDWLKTQR